MPVLFVRGAVGGNNGTGNAFAFTVEGAKVDRVLISVSGVRSATDSPITWRWNNGSTTGQQTLTQIGPTVISGSLQVKVKALINPTGSSGASTIGFSNPSSAGYAYWIGFYEGAKQDIATILRDDGLGNLIQQSAGTAPADPSYTVPCLVGDRIVWGAMQALSTNNAAAGPTPGVPPAVIRANFNSGTTSPQYTNLAELLTAATSEAVSYNYTGTSGWAGVAFAITPAPVALRGVAAGTSTAIITRWKGDAAGTSTATGTLTTDAPLLLVGSSGGTIATGAGSRSVTLTQAIPRDSTVLVGWHFSNSGGTSPYASAVCTDTKGNTYVTDILANNSTTRSLAYFRAVVTTALAIGDQITVAHGAGFNAGARTQMLVVRYNKILTPVAQSTVDSAFAATIDSTFTYTGPDNVFIAVAAGGFDSNDIIGVGDTAWKGHIDFSDSNSGVWFAYQPNPTGNDSWNAPLQQTRDFYGSGYVYDESEGGLKGTAAGTSTAVATMLNTLALHGTAAGAATGTSLLNWVHLIGEASWGAGLDEESVGEPYAFGSLGDLSEIQGSAAGSSTCIGRLGPGDRPLAGTAGGTSTAVGNLSFGWALKGTSAGTSTAIANMTGQWALKSTVPCGSLAQGILMVLNQDEWGSFPPPNVPPERVVYIRYRGVDITRRVIYEGTRFKTSARGSPGDCLIRVRDDAHELDFIPGGSITLDVGDIRQWGGYLGSVKRGYFFEGSHDSPGEIVRYVELRGSDYNILFHKRVLFDPRNPTNVQLTVFPADTPDDEVLEYYAAHHLDIAGDGLDTTTLVEHVGTPSQDDEISGAAGWSWWQFLTHMRFHTGAIDYIDPDKRVVHTDVDTPNADFGISDDPDETEVGCRELEMDFDAAKMRNDALVWGVGQGKDDAVFSRVTDATAIATHGLWQVGQYLPGVWRQATADRVADSWVYGSPQNKRGGKDDRVSAQCVVFEPTFRVAQKVTLRSAVWGFTDVIPIRDIEIDFPTPWHPRFKLTLSHEIDDPWTTYESFFPDFAIPDFTIKLPPIPQFIDPDTGDPIFGHGDIGSCNDGVYEYEVGGGAQSLLDAGLVRIQMKYSNGNLPESLPHIVHPSGDDWYMIDGSSSTGRSGYRYNSNDSVIWRSTVPLFVSGIRIDQGMTSGPAAGPTPSRHRSCWMKIYMSTRTDGVGKTQVGTWGGPLPSLKKWDPGGPSPNRLDGNGGRPVANITFGFDPFTENDPSTAPPGVGGTLYFTNVKYVEVASVQPWWFSNYQRTNHALRWQVSSAVLGASCVRTILPDPDGNIEGGGGSAYVGPSGTPEGEDPDAEYYYTYSSWLNGTLRVYVDGLLAQPGVDYEENADDHWIKFPEGFDGEVYIRYYPRT